MKQPYVVKHGVKFLHRMNFRAVNYNLQILKIPPRKLRMCNDLDFSIALLADLHRVAQISHPIVDLNFVVQEFFEGGDIKDFIGRRLGGINDKLYLRTFRQTHPLVSFWRIETATYLLSDLRRFTALWQSYTCGFL